MNISFIKILIPLLWTQLINYILGEKNRCQVSAGFALPHCTVSCSPTAENLFFSRQQLLPPWKWGHKVYHKNGENLWGLLRRVVKRNGLSIEYQSHSLGNDNKHLRNDLTQRSLTFKLYNLSIIAFEGRMGQDSEKSETHETSFSVMKSQVHVLCEKSHH